MEKKINLKTEKIVLVFLSIFLIGFVAAQPSFGSIPLLPDHFIGNVSIDGQYASIGTLIYVYVAGNLSQTYNITETGKYDLYVKTGNSGEAIEFKIQDISAGSSTRQGGQTIYLDLFVTTTSSPSDSSSGPSGSSGGGGGGSPGGINPSSTTTNESASGSEDTTQETETTEEDTNHGETGHGITGAVIGFLDSGKGIVAIIVFLALTIGVIAIKFKTPKWKRKVS